MGDLFRVWIVWSVDSGLLLLDADLNECKPMLNFMRRVSEKAEKKLTMKVNIEFLGIWASLLVALLVEDLCRLPMGLSHEIVLGLTAKAECFCGA